jgi:hypothetical protein
MNRILCQIIEKPAEAGGVVAGYEIQPYSIFVRGLFDLCPNTFTNLAC